MIWRRAAASATGSSWSMTMPAPLLSISTACGNAVATIGLPFAIASMSTPELTCSVESYGNTTTEACWISSASADFS